MWKRVIAAENQEETKKDDSNCLGSPTDPITAICEEEEEQASKEEESADGLDEREAMSAIEEEGILPLSETLSGNEEPEWYSKRWPPLEPGI